MATPALPIVLHAGFHKTGTSHVQQTLRSNRALLRPHHGLALKWHLRDLIHATRGYSTLPDPIGLAKVAHRADTWVAGLPPLRHRGLIASAEELSGHMPGRATVTDYGAAIPLLKEITQALLRRFGDIDIRIAFTTRDPATWLESAYWEHVKSSNMTLSLAEFRTRNLRAGAFTSLLDRLKDALFPIPVTAFALEDWAGDRLGAATPILRLAEVPEDVIAAFVPEPPKNTRLPRPVLQELLDLNRRIGDRETRRRAKQALIADAAKEHVPGDR